MNAAKPPIDFSIPETNPPPAVVPACVAAAAAPDIAPRTAVVTRAAPVWIAVTARAMNPVPARCPLAWAACSAAAV